MPFGNTPPWSADSPRAPEQRPSHRESVLGDDVVSLLKLERVRHRTEDQERVYQAYRKMVALDPGRMAELRKRWWETFDLDELRWPESAAELEQRFPGIEVAGSAYGKILILPDGKIIRYEVRLNERRGQEVACGYVTLAKAKEWFEDESAACRKKIQELQETLRSLEQGEKTLSEKIERNQ